MRRTVALWLGRGAVTRAAYAASGFSLMAVKYALDAGFVYTTTGRPFTPFDYMSPLLATRAELLESGQPWVLAVLIAWTLPFLWIGASLTIRRALDAGLSPWAGLLFFAPFLNYLWMLTLCLLPSRPRAVDAGIPERPGGVRFPDLRAAALAAALGMLAAAFSIFLVESYGAMLFMGTPFAMGFTAGYVRNREADAGLGNTLSAACLSVFLACAAFVLFALEGILCLAMGAPLALVLAALGAALGRAVARPPGPPARQLLGLLLALPLLMGAERLAPEPPGRLVTSSIEIDATPEQVWPHVIGFTELPPPSRLAFRLGIAFPMRARIEGMGVGAVRYCEFSTGAFVEPITAWEPPHRLAFDVTHQPPPMHEASPYAHVHAPHLVDGLLSRRGEFRLVRLSGGRTRLEGRTWYQLRMEPQVYWGVYSDALIASIHTRVLEHVKSEVEGRRP